MNRVWALIERDMRKLGRSPTLIVVSMIMPIVQLVILGYAFGGKIHDLRVGVVNQDRGMPTVKLREMCGAREAGRQTEMVARQPTEKVTIEEVSGNGTV